ncbi:MAG: hypothetical protein K2W96_22650, partial [Gemmataceae bacterium]|nr:hypothetical protein [Gemmataceae bacterium]
KIQASIERGHKLVLGTAACISCHNDYGRRSAYRYDEWGTLVRPANLTNYKYRGGRRPVDFYWRISGGIVPSGMSAITADKLPSPESYWDLVHFVQALPYPQMLPKDVRKAVYGDSEALGSSAAGPEKPH